MIHSPPKSLLFKEFGRDFLDGKGTFTVVRDYNPETLSDTLKMRVSETGSTISCLFNPVYDRFKKATDYLEPGKEYNLSIHRIVCPASYDAGLSFLAHTNGLFVGVHGLVYLSLFHPELLKGVEGKNIFSLDVEEMLYKNLVGNYWTAYARRYHPNKTKFFPSLSSKILTEEDVLLHISEH